MAKANQGDIDMALTLSSFLDSIDKGFVPDAVTVDSEKNEWLNKDDGEQCCRIVNELKSIIGHGNFFRVAYGLAVLLDPSNEVVDPEADTLEHHPKRDRMESALLWTLYHHQGGSSHIGQPIRRLLGIDPHAHLTSEQVQQAKQFGEGGAA